VASVTICDVMKKFGDETVLQHCDLQIADGEFVVLVGASGSGKTTLLRIVAGLEDPSDGEVFIGDQLVNDVDVKNRNIAMVFQNYALYPHMNVFDNMAFGLRRQHTPKPEIQQRVTEAAKILGIEHLLKRKPKQLSGGQRQRVALGRAIVRQPSVFLMDEPLSNLDAHLRAEMRGEILKLHRRLGATFIFVTHDQVEALTMGDRIAVMSGGKILQVGTPDDLYLRPMTQFVAGFIGTPAMGFVTCDVVSAGDRPVLRNPSVEIRLPAERAAVIARQAKGPVTVGFRPDYLRLIDSEAAVTSQTVLHGVVEVVEPLGADQHVLVRIGDATLTAKLPRTDRVQIDDKVVLAATDDVGIHVFDAASGEALR
jgi:multiple sugar transport system ATP-binding protein